MQLINLPNLLTLLNLFSGCMAIIFLFNYQIELVPYCVLVSLVADFFDGFAARFTKSASDIGKQLLVDCERRLIVVVAGQDAINGLDGSSKCARTRIGLGTKRNRVKE